MKNIRFSALALVFCLSLTACTPSKDSLKVSEEKYIQPVGFFVDHERCKTSPLSVEEFKTHCTYLSQASIDQDIMVKAIQDLPKTHQKGQKLDIGESIHLEFYKDNQQLNIPLQTFHTTWATDYLGISVSYVDDDHIYVSGSFPSKTPTAGYQSIKNPGSILDPYYDNDYTYLFHKGKWTSVNLQDLVGDTSRLRLFASDKLLKVVNLEQCFYDGDSNAFYDNDPHGSKLTGTQYILDAHSLKLMKKEEKPCVAEESLSSLPPKKTTEAINTNSSK